ncbi:MAG: hypothetical protein CL920_38680 [Deltaproteobacteria bacterium]|nr:hypothetical protein [Deltaproteobacteria bacterium]
MSTKEILELPAGTQIGDFRILRLLGHGGMGEVYLARDMQLGRKVALKLIHPSLVQQASSKKHFLFEARATAHFNHPNIVTIHNVGEYQQRPYVALEYLEGENLRERLNQETLPQKQILRMMISVVEALEEAHKHQLLHRDLKPENIFLPKDGRVRVLDFGLAKRLEDAPSLSNDITSQAEDTQRWQHSAFESLQSIRGAIVGTPPYMAPEQWRNEPLTPATDIWALGIILFEMFAGCRPFPHPKAEQLPLAPTAKRPAPANVERQTLQPSQAFEETAYVDEEEQLPPIKDSTPGPTEQDPAFEETAQYIAPLEEQAQELDISTKHTQLPNAQKRVGTPSRQTRPSADEIVRHSSPALPAQSAKTTLLAIFHQVTSDIPSPSVREFAPDTSPELSNLIARCLHKDPSKRPTSRELLSTLHSLLSDKDEQALRETNPFRGLRPFTEAQANFFFGREVEIESFIERMREQTLLPVLGASGAGKSSFVRAGVLPRLKERGVWQTIQMRPGSKPFHALAIAFLQKQSLQSHTSIPSEPSFERVSSEDQLHQLNAQTLAASWRAEPGQLSLALRRRAERTGKQLLLFVDQFEELFTLVDDDEIRLQFMKALAGAADEIYDPIRVVLTMRSDFLEHWSAAPELQTAIRQMTILAAPDRNMLVDVITKPLKMLGYTLDDEDLLDEIIGSLKDETSSLPLLQFTLSMLWERRDKVHKTLRRKEYEEIGGIEGALASHAEALLEKMSSKELSTIRRILLKMVTPAGTRKVISKRALLDQQPKEAEEVLTALVQSRLVSVRKSQNEEGTESMFELAHESLLKHWHQLAEWVHESDEERLKLDEVEQGAELWRRRGRREEETWQGEGLRDILQTFANHEIGLSSLAREFLEASQNAEKKRTRRKQRNVLLIRSSIATFMILTVIFAGVFYSQWENASWLALQRNRALDNVSKNYNDYLFYSAQTEEQRGNTWTSQALLRQEVEQTLKRFHQQKRRFPSLKKERRLWVRLQANKRLWKRTLFLPSIHGQPVFSQDRRKIALIAKDRLVILDTLLPHQQQDILLKNAKKVAFSAQTNSINALEIIQAKRLLHYHPILQLRSRGVFPGTLQHIAVQKARTLLVLRAKPNTTLFIHLRVRDTSHKLWRTTYKHIDGISWHPSKQTFIVWGLLSNKRYGVSLWRRTQSGTWSHATRSLHSAITKVTWHPKQARIAFGHLDGHISIWNTTSLRERSRPGQLRCEIMSLRYSHRGQLFSTDAQGRVYLWRPNKTHPRLILRVRKQGLSGMVLGPQGRRMLVMRKYKRSGDIRLVVSLWRLYSASTRKDAYVSPGALSVSVYHPNQQLAFSGGKDKIIRSWDLTTGAVNIQLEGHEYEIIHLVMSRDGQWLVSGDRQGHILLWNLQQQRLVRRFHLHYHSPIALRFLESPRRILSVDASGRSVLFDVKTGHITEEKPLFQDGLQTTKLRWKMLPKSNILAAFKARRGIWLWALEESQRKFIKLPNLLHLDVSSHGRSFATLLQTRKGSQLQLWDIESNQHKDLALFPRQIRSLALRPNDKDIALFGRGVGVLYNIRTQKRTQLRGVPPGFQALAWQFHPKGHLLTATGGVFQTRHWDVKTGMPLWYTIFFDRQRLRLLTHQGWEAIAPHKHPKPTHHKKWETRLHTHGWRASEHNELLCIHTRQDTLELWNKRLDQKLYTYKSRSLKKAIATPHGCFLLVYRNRNALNN